MDGIFGVIDGSLKLSIVDSTMMSILHRAMDKAHERVKSREGIIDRLHEISKFYELSVMQLDGCIKFVQLETQSHKHNAHEEVLAGLAEIRNRLRRRLQESELAILQKDRELADRFESESKLRQALEITERELVSSQEGLQLERWEMGSDIDVLKETLDIAFGKMQNAIFSSEVGAAEERMKCSIQNDVVAVSLKGVVRDLEAEFVNGFLLDLQIGIQQVFFREVVGEWEERTQACTLETSISEEICYTVLNEAERGACCKKLQGTNAGLRSLVHKLNSVSQGIEEVENLVVVSSFEMLDDNCKDVECILSSLSDKIEKTVKLFNNKFMVGELKSSLETNVGEPEKVCEFFSLREAVPETQLSSSELHKKKNSDSECLELEQNFYDFQVKANENLEAIMLRLEEMRHTLDPVPQVVASLRENESLYKKAFIRRCQNLRKAENEVDLLGDQVDILLSLIEKIYLTLNQHSPVLEQYFDVSEILRLIEEVAVIVCMPSEKLDTTSNV